ncbi:MAG: metal ABC transporter permease [Candidatus Marinamargulisbacteria bacterium]
MTLLILPMIACLALVWIHILFGQHVIRRGIIFIDLALAQWAALGYLIGHILHIESPALLFTTAFLFSGLAGIILTGLRPFFSGQNKQEALIGVMYIMGNTMATAIIATQGLEGHHLSEMLAGHILFVSSQTIAFSIMIYAICAFLLRIIYQNVATSSRAFDILFYGLFGLVVTSSVKMVGVLLVFSYLVIPLLTTGLFTQRDHPQKIAAWAIGMAGSGSGLLLSLFTDIPASYSIILTLGILLLIGIIFRKWLV